MDAWEKAKAAALKSLGRKPAKKRAKKRVAKKRAKRVKRMTPGQSASRVAKLRSQGYTVTRRVIPGVGVVVLRSKTKKRPAKKRPAKKRAAKKRAAKKKPAKRPAWQTKTTAFYRAELKDPHLDAYTKAKYRRRLAELTKQRPAKKPAKKRMSLPNVRARLAKLYKSGKLGEASKLRSRAKKAGLKL